MSASVDLPSEHDTLSFAQRIAPHLAAGDFIALYGDLGAGKSTFARALIRALCEDESLEVPSPTFTLVQTYEGPQYPIFHFDLYRIETLDELAELGFEETIDGLAVVEWPQRMQEELPRHRLDIRLEFASEGRRAILFAHGEGWSRRVADIVS